jgi:hypothetical protein
MQNMQKCRLGSLQ